MRKIKIIPIEEDKEAQKKLGITERDLKNKKEWEEECDKKVVELNIVK